MRFENRWQFYSLINLAADKLLKDTGGKKDPGFMVHDGDLLSAARTFSLDDATGTPSTCPISHAITTAAFDRGNPMHVIAVAEEAWDWYRKKYVLGAADAEAA